MHLLQNYHIVTASLLEQWKENDKSWAFRLIPGLALGIATYTFSVTFTPNRHFADDAAAALRDQVTCSRSHRQEVGHGKSRGLCFEGICLLGWLGLESKCSRHWDHFIQMEDMWTNVGSPKAQEVGSNLQAAIIAGEIDSLGKLMILIIGEGILVSTSNI